MADNYCKCCGDGTPEYIIELNQQGAPGKRGEKGEQGYSPIVDFIVDDNEIKFTSTNENNITSTPNLYDYVLKKDGTNALNPVKFNHIYIKNNSIYTQDSSIDLGNSSSNNQLKANIYYRNINLKGNSPYLQNDYGELTIRGQSGLYLGTISGSISLGNTIYITDNIPYVGTPGANSKIATIGDIPEVSDSKITISQGNVVKGSFTLNQSGDTTIELDSGLTNPLKIEGATEDNPSGGTITYSMELGLDSSNKVYLSQITDYFEQSGGHAATVSRDIIKDNIVVGIPEIRNSITELTTLANNTEASLNELKTDYEANKTEVAEELTNLGNQLNNKANLSDLANYVPLTTYNELLARVEALEAEINGGNA